MEVAKVLLSLEFQDNSGTISNQVKQSAEKISKNAGDIDLKLKEPDMKGFAEKIQSGMKQINKLVGKNGKLSNVKNISSQMEDLYGSFADSKNGPEQWAASVDKTYERLSKLTNVKHADLLENLQPHDLKKIIDNYETLEEKQAAYNNARAKAQNNFQELPKQKVGDIYKEARNSSEESKKYFKEAIDKKNLEAVAGSLGLNLDSKNAEVIQGYAQRLVLQQFLSDKRSKLKLDKPENVLEAAKLTQQMLTLRDSITNSEDVLKNNFGATKTPSNKITGFTSKILTNELNGFQHQYTQLFVEQALKEFEDAQTTADQYVLEAAKKRNQKQQEKSEKAVADAEEDLQKKQNKIKERRGITSPDNTSGNGTGTGNGNGDSNSSATSSTSDSQIEKDAEDIWKESYEKIKSKYSDKVNKYAISEDEAIERLSKLQKKAKNPDALTDGDLEEYLGIDSRLNTLKEHGKLKNFDAIDDLNDLYDIFNKEWFFPLSDSQDKFKKELDAMNADQLSAMEEIQKTREAQKKAFESEKEKLSQELAQKQEQGKVRQAESEKVSPIAESTEPINTDNVESSEISEMAALQEAVNSVTSAVNSKIEAFEKESSTVSSSVASEVSELENLKDAVDNVSKAKEEAAQKEEEINQKQKEAEAAAEQEAKKQEVKAKADSSKKEQSNSQRNTSNNSTSKKKESTESPKISDIPSTYVKNIDKAFDEATAINNALKKSESLKSNITSQFASIPSVSEGATSQIETLNNQLKSGQISVKKYNSEISKLSSSLKHVDDYADNADNAIEKMTQKAMELSNGKASITSSIKKDAQGNDIAKLVASWEGNKLTGTFSDATKGISFLTQQTQTSTTAVGQFFDGLKERWTSLGQYLLSFGGFYQVFDVLKDGFNIIHDLDDALTEMNKVSEEPLDKLKSYQKESFDIANDIGTTGTQIQNSTADFLRLGESFDDAKESAKAANILLNVSEFSSIDEATESLIAMSSAYKDLDKMEIDDKLNNVGNNFSISTDGLATALQKSASALTTAGNDIDKSIALITAGNAVVQDPDSVGAGIRTIALRLTGTEEAKKELEETGEDTSDFIVQTASKVDDSFKAFTGVASNNFKGISLLDENGNLRDTYDVLQDVADIYEEIVETDKKYGTNHLNGLLELMAGKNRANIAASIIQNGDMLKDVYEASQNSEGSALEENQKQLDSISGHLDQLKNKWQQVWSGTASRNQVNFVLDGLKGALDIVNKIGLVPSTLMAGFGLKGAANKLQGKQGIFSGLFGWPKIQGYA